jgi:hypothetical protein
MDRSNNGAMAATKLRRIVEALNQEHHWSIQARPASFEIVVMNAAFTTSSLSEALLIALKASLAYNHAKKNAIHSLPALIHSGQYETPAWLCSGPQYDRAD